MKTVAVVNPHSAGGRTGDRLAEITRAIRSTHDNVSILATGGPLDAERLTREALNKGTERVIAVGGDGTIGDVVNGFFVNRIPVNPHAEFAILELGTGGDFRRTFSIPDRLEDGVRRIAEGTSSLVDVGVARVATSTGTLERCFANIASAGMSAEVATRVNRRPWFKQHLGAVFFGWSAALAVLGRPRYRVRLTGDDGPQHLHDLAVCAVCNGRFFGGGMLVAPDADPADGLFDVLTVDAMPPAALLSALRRVYAGKHLRLPGVRHFRARAVRVDPVDPGAVIPVELDGDTPDAILPAAFEIMPRALLFRR